MRNKWTKYLLPTFSYWHFQWFFFIGHNYSSKYNFWLSEYSPTLPCAYFHYEYERYVQTCRKSFRCCKNGYSYTYIDIIYQNCFINVHFYSPLIVKPNNNIVNVLTLICLSKGISSCRTRTRECVDTHSSLQGDK